jgi:hypothetical protein
MENRNKLKFCGNLTLISGIGIFVGIFVIPIIILKSLLSEVSTDYSFLRYTKLR